MVGMVAALAATASPKLLRFESVVIEVDTIRYDGGPRTVRFVCTNIADKPVTILDVSAQCGCTVPKFQQTAIRPGEKGWVEVTLKPDDLYGEQIRHLTVISTNGDYRRFNTITVHGYVERDQTEGEIRYPYLLGHGLRTDNRTLGMSVKKDGDNVRTVSLYNDTDKDVSVQTRGSWRLRSAEQTVPARSRVDIDVDYRLWFMRRGEFTDSLRFVVDGQPAENALEVRVTLRD